VGVLNKINSLVYFPNLGGSPVTFGPALSITSTCTVAMDVFAIDLTSDNRPDFLLVCNGLHNQGSPGIVMYIINTGSGTFAAPVIIAQSAALVSKILVL
jgi:hypothetical protein